MWKEEKVDKVFEILAEYNQRYSFSFSFGLDRLSNKIYWVGVVGSSIVSVFTILLSMLFQDKSWFQLIWALLIVSAYFSLVAHAIALSFESRKEIKKFSRNPLDLILTQIKQDSIDDIALLNKLLVFEVPFLEYVNRQVKAERVAFERRVGVISGALEKVGILPGIISATVAIHKIYSNEGLPVYIQYIVIAILILYCFSIYFHHLFNRMDRYILVLETAIGQRKLKP
ncbi:MAG TPA: hypothetical protein EYH06_06065 [Chromatiales bacterium]|nr:hypothetical protein [Chromatiales bacterium]